MHFKNQIIYFFLQFFKSNWGFFILKLIRLIFFTAIWFSIFCFNSIRKNTKIAIQMKKEFYRCGWEIFSLIKTLRSFNILNVFLLNICILVSVFGVARSKSTGFSRVLTHAIRDLTGDERFSTNAIFPHLISWQKLAAEQHPRPAYGVAFTAFISV